LAGLTTHVLDVTRGGPAERVRVELYEFAAAGGRTLVVDVLTNADGRTDAPLIGARHARVGRFELVFHAGDEGIGRAQRQTPRGREQSALLKKFPPGDHERKSRTRANSK